MKLHVLHSIFYRTRTVCHLLFLYFFARLISIEQNGGSVITMSTPSPVQQLEHEYQKLKMFNIVFFCLALLALFFCFVKPTLAVVTLAVSFVLKLLPGRRLRKTYEKHIIHFRALKCMQPCMDNVWHKQEPSLSEQEIREVRLLPCNASAGSVLCCESGTGHYHGKAVSLGDVTLTHTYTENSRKQHNFLVGCWIQVELHTDTRLDCRFIGKNMLPWQSLKEMLWVEPDLKLYSIPLVLNSSWSILCPKENSAMPGDAFLKQLEKLHQKTDGQIAVCICGNHLHIFLKGEILGKNVNPNIPPAPQLQHTSILADLPDALALCDFLTEDKG